MNSADARIIVTAFEQRARVMKLRCTASQLARALLVLSPAVNYAQCSKGDIAEDLARGKYNIVECAGGFEEFMSAINDALNQLYPGRN